MAHQNPRNFKNHISDLYTHINAYLRKLKDINALCALFVEMMKEHIPRQASQRRRQRIVGHTPAQIFEFPLKLMRQT